MPSVAAPAGAHQLGAMLSSAQPRLTRDFGSVQVSVYRAKSSIRSTWASHALRALVAEARESYRVSYGRHVPLFDAYDQKAWVYLAVAHYSSCGASIYEALTLRFVPAAGRPALNDDLNFYHSSSAPELTLAELLQGRGAPVSEPLGGCYSQSRMGSLRPRAEDGRSLAGNRHVGLAWCLMLDCFLEDAARSGRPCRMLTAQTTELLRALGSRIPMRPADEALGLEPGSLALHRREPHVRQVCYGVPTYFLNLVDVSRLLSRLLDEGQLSAPAVGRTLAQGASIQRVLARPRAHTFEHLNELLDARGPIQDARLTGERLRELCDVEVGDGPVLRLTQLDQLSDELTRLRRSELPRESAPPSNAGARTPSRPLGARGIHEWT